MQSYPIFRYILFLFIVDQIASQLNANLDKEDVLRAVQAVAHFALKYPSTQINGICIIADMRVDSIEVLQLVFKYVRFALPTIVSDSTIDLVVLFKVTIF